MLLHQEVKGCCDQLTGPLLPSRNPEGGPLTAAPPQSAQSGAGYAINANSAAAGRRQKFRGQVA